MSRTCTQFLVLAAVLLGVVVAASGGQEQGQQAVRQTVDALPGTMTSEGAVEQPQVQERERSLLGGGYGWKHAKKGGRRFRSCLKNATVCNAKGSKGPDCCHGHCTNVKKDKNSCGRCGLRCRSGTTCCGGKCVNVYNDSANCGSCGQQCLSSEYCYRGLCNYNGLD